MDEREFELMAAMSEAIDRPTADAVALAREPNLDRLYPCEDEG